MSTARASYKSSRVGPLYASASSDVEEEPTSDKKTETDG